MENKIDNLAPELGPYSERETYAKEVSEYLELSSESRKVVELALRFIDPDAFGVE